MATNDPIIQATTSTAATFIAAPPIESTTVAGRHRSLDRTATPIPEVSSIPSIAAMNTTRIATKACTFGLEARAARQPRREDGADHDAADEPGETQHAR